MASLAKQYGALMLALEHRFYGESYPTADMSVQSLRYLSSHQALADLARFISYVRNLSPVALDVKSTPPLRLKAAAARSKWVSFGGSYPGALSGWLKLKYPASLAGAVSSSPPYFAEYNFEQYAQVVGSALSNPAIGGSAACFNAVKDATHALRQLMVKTKPLGADPAIPAALRPCGNTSLRSELDLATYEASIFSGFQGTVQYNNELPVVATVAVLCAKMTDTSISADPVARLAFVQENVYSLKCQPSSFEKDMLAPLLNETFDGYGCNLSCASGRQWIWQSCNEFGYFQTTTSTGAGLSPFAAFANNTIAVAGKALCEGLFGLSRPPATEETNTFYGGRQLLAENVTIVNGGMDPWHSLSIVDAADPYYESCVDAAGKPIPPGEHPCQFQRVGSSSSVLTIPSTAHCGDMYAPNLFTSSEYCPGPSCHADSQEIVDAHSKIKADVGRYIGRMPRNVEDIAVAF